ncbi:MAG: PPC domain-containing DNA-binding protein [Candidatus Bathyarchaeia archaeon]|jgi:predicted DNA-binding protein with PD1-like motif
MDYTEANIGRIFILRLQQDEVLHEEIEKFAVQKQIKSGLCFFLGGADDLSKVVVGPRDGKNMPPEPMATILQGAHEGVGVGTIFVNEAGKPKLHMHASFGREDCAVTGCVRMGVEVWQIGEVVILELTGCTARRAKDKQTGFELLQTRALS